MKKYLIIGIVFLVVSLGLTIYNEFINTPVNLYSLTNSASKEEDKKAYIDATFVAGTITGNNDKSFYVMFGDGVQYIVYVDNKLANKVNTYLLDNPDDSYHIEGVSKLIPESIVENGKKFVKEWLDNNHTHGEEVEENHTHDITTDDFYHYFGYVYLDTTSSISIIKITIYLTGIVGVLLIIHHFNTKYHFI